MSTGRWRRAWGYISKRWLLTIYTLSGVIIAVTLGLRGVDGWPFQLVILTQWAAIWAGYNLGFYDGSGRIPLRVRRAAKR